MHIYYVGRDTRICHLPCLGQTARTAPHRTAPYKRQPPPPLAPLTSRLDAQHCLVLLGLPPSASRSLHRQPQTGPQTRGAVASVLRRARLYEVAVHGELTGSFIRDESSMSAKAEGKSSCAKRGRVSAITGMRWGVMRALVGAGGTWEVDQLIVTLWGKLQEVLVHGNLDSGLGSL